MPSVIEAIVLGVIQGLTEFLPISSDGHLTVVPTLLGWDTPSLSFDLALHAGTLVAVVAYFWTELVRLLLGVLGRGRPAHAHGARPAGAAPPSGGTEPTAGPAGPETAAPTETTAVIEATVEMEEPRRLTAWLVLGTIPAAVVGLVFRDEFEDLFDEPLWACAFWLVTAIALVAGELAHRRAAPSSLTTRMVLAIGVAQVPALAPGISRSGLTIAAGLALGLSRVDAARFSFLLSVPAVAGAVLTGVPDVLDGRFELDGAVLAGFLAALVVGYLAVAALLRLIRTRSFMPFAAYLVVVAPLAALGVR